MPDASPLPLIIATADGVTTQVADVVRSWVLPSLKTPVAATWRVVPSGIDTLAGARSMDTSAGADTVSVVLAETPSSVADAVTPPAA